MVAISTGSSSPLRGLKFYQAKYAREFVLGHDHSGLTTGPAILVLGKVNDTMERICQLVSRVWLPLALLLETSSDRQHIRHLFGRPLLVL